MKNQKVTRSELAKIRRLADFEVVMLISDIHDNGWAVARRTLCLMPPDPDEKRHKWLAENTGRLVVPATYKNALSHFEHLVSVLKTAENQGLSDEEALDLWERRRLKTGEVALPPHEEDEVAP